MADPFVGEIMVWAGNFAPSGWALCNGQLLPIAQHTALFSLLGTTYGGNGTTTFALPDLQGRVPIHAGQGPGLSNRLRGEKSGSESVTLEQEQLPVHTHTLPASSENGTRDGPPAGVLPARNPAGIPQYSPAADADLGPGIVGTSGGGQPHNNMQPYLTLNYIIALTGIFPSQWPSQRD